MAGRLTRHKGRSSKSENADDVSSATARDDHSDYGVEKPNPKRSRPRKKQDSDKPGETIESLQSGRDALLKLYHDEKAKNKDLKAKKATVTKDNTSRRRHQTALKREVKDLEERLKNKRASSADLGEKLAEKDELMKQRTEACFRLIGKGASDALDDKYAHDGFNEI